LPQDLLQWLLSRAETPLLTLKPPQAEATVGGLVPQDLLVVQAAEAQVELIMNLRVEIELRALVPQEIHHQYLHLKDLLAVML
jgi:hypothetical protein